MYSLILFDLLSYINVSLYSDETLILEFEVFYFFNMITCLVFASVQYWYDFLYQFSFQFS